MTPEERKLIDDLFGRLATLETNPRDPDAARAIADGLTRAPNAIYPLVQSVLVQDEALKRADAHIRELEAQLGVEPAQPAQPGGFLDNMRDTLFGKRGPQGSVPTVRPSGVAGGVTPQRTTPPQPSSVWGGTAAPAQPAGAPPGIWPGAAAPAQPAGIGTPTGGSFLGTAAAAAAGVIGGALLMNSFRSMFGSHNPQQTAFDQPSPGSATPWAPNATNSDLARDAGLNDIGSNPRTAAYDDKTQQPAGLFDDTNNDDNFNVADSGDFDIGGDSDIG